MRLAAGSAEHKTTMIAATYLKAHRTASSLRVKKGSVIARSDAPRAARTPSCMLSPMRRAARSGSTCQRVRSAISVVAACSARRFLPYWRVIECELLSGLVARHFQKPRARMVISGLGPNLHIELSARIAELVFSIRIRSIILLIQVVVFSHSPWHRRYQFDMGIMLRLPAPDPCNLRSSSASPKSAEPSCWPARSRPALWVCAPTFVTASCPA